MGIEEREEERGKRKEEGGVLRRLIGKGKGRKINVCSVGLGDEVASMTKGMASTFQAVLHLRPQWRHTVTQGTSIQNLHRPPHEHGNCLKTSFTFFQFFTFF